MNLEIVKESNISYRLQDFPPRLRKIAKFMLNSNKLVTIDDAINELKLNTKSIYNGISDSRKKGNDFYEFLNQSFHIMLSRSKFEVGKALVREAVSDSHMDRKLFFQLAGDLKNETNINIGSLSLGININSISLPSKDQDKGVIDIQPVIPKVK